MSEVGEQLFAIKERIALACKTAGRDAGEVTLIAVSKTFPAEAVQSAWDAGQRVFGESRQQEAVPKVELLPKDIVWHFIGGIQRNKVRKILPYFRFIHAVDSLRLAQYINEVAGELGVRPSLFLQVNQAAEESKGGFGEDELRSCAHDLASLKNVDIVGLMAIPPEENSVKWFRALRVLRDDLVKHCSMKLPFLSMGMSGDFEEAIAEGATHVRVGSAIFGKREGKIEGELG